MTEGLTAHGGDDLPQDEEQEELRESILSCDRHKTLEFNKLETIQSGEHIFNFDGDRYDILID